MKPFEGIRVLDLTHVFAGPFSTYQLAVMGADVIKIEPPDNPDMTRFEGEVAALNEAQMGVYFQTQASNKRSLTLNLKTPKGKKILLDLARTADVMVENYSGGSLEGLGLGYEDVAKVNPQIIYCSLTGYGRTGPKGNDPSYDLVIQAYSGLMHANGTPETSPVKVGPAVIDYGTGAHAAMAISAALFQRTRTGKGQRIDVSMLDAALMLMSSSVTATLTTGNPPPVQGIEIRSRAGYACYMAKDDLLAIGAWTRRQMSKLFDVIGAEDRASEVLDTPRHLVSQSLESDTALISAAISTKTADEWEEILNKAGIPAGKARKMDETMSCEQLASRPVMQDSKLSGFNGSPSRFPVAAFTYQHGSPEITSAPPQLGEHNEEILGELGYSPQDVSQLRDSGVI